jgi:SAM-dependent methyltransferase
MARTVGTSDAFGHALMAHWQRGIPWYIVERDDGYIDAGPVGEYFSTFRAWKHDAAALRYATGRIVDIGCGAGRHVQYLQKRGFRAEGIDPSPLTVKVCRLRGIKDVRVGSLETLPNGRKRYDTFIMFGNNFGLFGSKRHAHAMLRRLLKCSTPHARIIAECRNPYITSDDAHMCYNKANARRGRMYGQIRIRVRFEQYTDPWFDYLFVSPKEMRELVHGTGWRVAKVIGRGAEYCAVIERES